MSNGATATIRPTALAAVELAHAAILDALLDAEMGNWRTTEQTFDAALRILEGARLLPGRHTANTDRFPLLKWSEDADGWVPHAEVRAAIRGDRATAAALVAMVAR